MDASIIQYRNVKSKLAEYRLISIRRYELRYTNLRARTYPSAFHVQITASPTQCEQHLLPNLLKLDLCGSSSRAHSL